MCSLAIVVRTQDPGGSFSICAMLAGGREMVGAVLPSLPTKKHAALIFPFWIDVKHLK